MCFENPLPSFVILPFAALPSIDEAPQAPASSRQKEKTFDIFLRKNSRTTLSAKKLIETPQICQWLDSAVLANPKKQLELQKETSRSAEGMHLIRLPLLLSGEKVSDYSSMDAVKFFINFYSLLPEETWTRAGSYAIVKS